MHADLQIVTALREDIYTEAARLAREYHCQDSILILVRLCALAREVSVTLNPNPTLNPTLTPWLQAKYFQTPAGLKVMLRFVIAEMRAAFNYDQDVSSLDVSF